MKLIFVNPHTDLIGNTIDVDYNSLSSDMFNYNVFIPGTTEKYRRVNWEDVTLPKNITSDQVFKNISQYVCDSNNVLHTRPFITMGVVPGFENYRVNSHGMTVFPTNTVIPIIVTYNDPDNIGYINISKVIKIKDRNEFVELPFKQKQFDEVNGITQTQFTFEIMSEVPGAFQLRAKDTKYMCYYETLSGNFKKTL